MLDNIKSVFSILKDTVLFITIIIIFIYPNETKNFLLTRGVNNIDFLGNKIILKDIGQKISGSEQVVDLLNSGKFGPDEINLLKKFFENVQAANEKIKSSLADTPGGGGLLTASKDQPVTSAATGSSQYGWVFAGKIDENKTAWSPNTTRTVNEENLTSSSVTLTDDVYVRADTTSGKHASAPILGVMRNGDVVQVLDRDYSHGIGGGWFMWLKVRVERQ
jgi:hypothetical protein